MKAAIGKCWRDSASLIVLANRKVETSTVNKTETSNYDILLQTRPHTASFSNSVVFPGGVTEEADADESWLRLISSFGFNEHDFAALHTSETNIRPIFADNPVKRHVALRISAIRETFEELGLLICSTEHKNNRSGLWANVVQCNDIKYWRDQIGKDPLNLLNLCKEYKCYPDIWSLHFWSNWLTPSHFSNRFDTAFFVAALPTNAIKLASDFNSSEEVAKVEWAAPLEVLDRGNKGEVQLYPPQGYEFYRLSHFTRLEDLIKFAAQNICNGDEFVYSVRVQAKDGVLFAFPGDDLFPNVNYIKDETIHIDKTVLQLRESAKTVHRAEIIDNTTQTLVFRNYVPKNHINMGDVILPFNVKLD